MPMADRAKQFMPFAALKGLEQALEEKEKIVVDKIVLTEDSLDELNIKLMQLRIHDIVTVVYYSNNEYIKLTGMVSKITLSSRVLQIVNTKISLDDIYSLHMEKWADRKN